MRACSCSETHETRRVVLTGGPGAGKTAVLELIRQSMCAHVRVLPEAASIIFGGGFPRDGDPECRRAAQLAIYHVQRALELTGTAHNAAILLCDRGTVDGLAYWPGAAGDFWTSAGTTLEAELRRYSAVIHLRTPTAVQGYNRQNPLRTESASTAVRVDAAILDAWAGHPRRHVVDSQDDFIDKAAMVLDLIRAELPECCSVHLEEKLAPSNGPP